MIVAIICFVILFFVVFALALMKIAGRSSRWEEMQEFERERKEGKVHDGVTQ